MGRDICKKVSIIGMLLGVCGFSPDIAQADFAFHPLQTTSYTETSWLPQYDDVVVSSKLRLEGLDLGPVHAYGGALLEQDTKSSPYVIYNDNGVSPLVGAWMSAFIPEIAIFSEFHQTFRLINRPETRSSSQPDLLLGSYGYRYWQLSVPVKLFELFEEGYGDFIVRSKLSYDPTLESWSKTGGRLSLGRGFSTDAFLDIEFRRATTGEREDAYQTFGPGIRLNYISNFFSASLSAHQEIGNYVGASGDSISRWKGLFVLSGALQ